MISLIVTAVFLNIWMVSLFRLFACPEEALHMFVELIWIELNTQKHRNSKQQIYNKRLPTLLI